MSTELETNLRAILQEKTDKIIPENIKKDVTIFDVTGTYEASTSTLDLTSGIKFAGSKFTTLPNVIINANWQNVTDTTDMFQQCIHLTEFPLVDLSNLVNMTYMFWMCDRLTNIPLLNTSNVQVFKGTFADCSSLTTIPLLNTHNATNMSNMFWNCHNLTEVPELDTSNVTNMSGMFYGCTNLTTVPLLDTSKVTNMSKMFNNCTSLSDTSLDNILQMCINATSYTGSKTLATLGFNATNYPASRIEALTHYQDFIDAGWTIGY